jgi:hypothetical protein
MGAGRSGMAKSYQWSKRRAAASGKAFAPAPLIRVIASALILIVASACTAETETVADRGDPEAIRSYVVGDDTARDAAVAAQRGASRALAQAEALVDSAATAELRANDVMDCKLRSHSWAQGFEAAMAREVDLNRFQALRTRLDQDELSAVDAYVRLKSEGAHNPRSPQPGSAECRAVAQSDYIGKLDDFAAGRRFDID